MGQANRTLVIAEEVHAALIQALGPTKVPRDKVDAVILKHYRIGGQQAYRVVRDGEVLGLWIRHRGTTSGGVGFLELRPLPETQPPSPQPPESTTPTS